MLPQYVPAVETAKYSEDTAVSQCCMRKKQKPMEDSIQIESNSRLSSSVQQPMQPLLGKRRQSQQEDCLMYCFQLMSVMKISFGDSLLDSYFEVVQNIFGEKNAISILNRASRSVNYTPITNSSDSSKVTSNNPTVYSTDIEKSKELLREVHRLIEKRLNIEIQRRVVAFKACMDACQSLALLDSSQSLLDFLHGNTIEGESGYYLKIIKEFIGSDNLRELILQSLSKERTKMEITKRESESSQEIHTAENNSYEDSFSTSSNPGDEDQPIQASFQASHTGLASILKTSVLFQVMPQLANLSEKIICIKNFTLQYC